MIKKSIFLVLFLLIFCCGLVFSALYFLLNTKQGFNVIFNVSQIILNSQFDIQITTKNAEGILLEYIKFGELKIKYFDESSKKSNEIIINNFDFSWSPENLYNFNRKQKFLLEVNNIAAKKITLNLPENSASNDEKFTLPENIKLPFDLQYKIKNLAIQNLIYNNQKIFENLQLNSYSADNFYYLNLQKFNISNFKTNIHLNAKINQNFPYEFTLNSHIKTDNIQNLFQNNAIQKNSLNINLKLHGNSQKNHLQIISHGGIISNSNFEITLFQAPFLTSANVDLQRFNPQLLNADLPYANIHLNAKIIPQQIDFSQLQNTKNLALLGEINLQNFAANSYDKNAIPLSKIISKFSWKNDVLNIQNLEITNNNSKVNINNATFALKDFVTDVNINLQNINAHDFISTLPSTNINGNLQLKGDINKQFLNVKLENKLANTNGKNNNQLPLKFDASLTHNQQQKFIEISKLSLETIFKNIKIFNDTTLKILYKKSLQDSENLKNFANFEIQNIKSSTRIDENFLNLNGKITHNKNDLNLDLLVNNLQFLRNFNLNLQSKKINAKATINGTLQQPIISGNFVIDELINNDTSMKIHNASLDFLLGGNLSNNANANLKIKSISTNEQPKLLRDFELTLNGTNQQHQLKIYALLPKRQHLNFVLDGKFFHALNTNLFNKQNATIWEGKIAQLELNQKTKNTIYSLIKNDFKNTIKISAKNNTHNINIDELAINVLQKSSIYADKANVPQMNLTAITNILFANKKSLQVNSKINGSKISPLNAELNLLLNNDFKNINSNINLNIADLSWVAPIIGDVWNSKGELNTNLEIKGNIDNPDINGNILAKNLAITNSDLNLNLHDGIFDADINKSILKINNFTWLSKLSKAEEIPNKLLHIRADNEDSLQKLVEKSGKISINGELKLNATNSANNAKLNLIIDRFGLAQKPQQWLISSGKADILLDEHTLKIDGDFKIDAAYIVLQDFDSTPSTSNDIVIRQNANNTTSQNLQWQPNIDINLNFGTNFLFSGYGLTTQLFGNIDILAKNNDLPRGKGRIRTLNGVFEAYGQRLKITRGEISFNNLLTNPSLNIRALRENLAVNAGVAIRGDVNFPRITLISEPEVPDAEKLSWLILGHGAESMSASDSALLMTAANGLLGDSSGGIISQIKNGIGIDEFSVKQGNVGQNNNRRPSSKIVGSSQDNSATTGNQILTIGKNFSSNTKIIYEQSLGQADSLLRIYRKFGRNLTLAATGGSDNAFDIFYNIIFGWPPNAFQSGKNNKN